MTRKTKMQERIAKARACDARKNRTVTKRRKSDDQTERLERRIAHYKRLIKKAQKEITPENKRAERSATVQKRLADIKRRRARLERRREMMAEKKGRKPTRKPIRERIAEREEIRKGRRAKPAARRKATTTKRPSVKAAPKMIRHEGKILHRAGRVVKASNLKWMRDRKSGEKYVVIPENE